MFDEIFRLEYPNVTDHSEKVNLAQDLVGVTCGVLGITIKEGALHYVTEDALRSILANDELEKAKALQGVGIPVSNEVHLKARHSMVLFMNKIRSASC